MDWMEKLMAQLDADEPQWVTRWATGAELQSFALERGDPEKAYRRLRDCVGCRILHRVCNAAIGAGLMTETE